jgi:hypothetical protein
MEAVTRREREVMHDEKEKGPMVPYLAGSGSGSSHLEGT